MLLRAAVTEDIPALVALERTASASRFVGQWSEERHRATLAGDDARYLVSEAEDGRIEAYVILRGLAEDSGSIELKRIVVASPGQGLGRRILAEILRIVFEDLHAHRLFLDVYEDNARARHLYESLGFVYEGVMRGAARRDGAWCNLRLMSLLEGEYKETASAAKARTNRRSLRSSPPYPRPSGIHSLLMETTGCGTAIVTPFRADGAIDEQALQALVDWQIGAGIDFIVACGSTGEAATLDEEEWLDTIRIVVDAAAGRVPVWAGCTHNSTRTLLRQATLLREVDGVDVILSANPYYNKPSQEGQYQHFLALAYAVNPIPVCLYNVPGRTAANLEPQTVIRLAESAGNIQAIKEASGSLPQIARLMHRLPPGFKVFSGDDNLALATLGIGAHGLISVASNEAPAEVGTMIRAALQNDWTTARQIEAKFGTLFEANFWDANPGPVKTVLNLMGKCRELVRLPLVTPEPALRARLEKVAAELGLLKCVPAGQIN